MSNPNQPETLPELLRTLERSVDLRSLARECGLSVRELRRRLSIWRREIKVEPDADPSTSKSASRQATSKGDRGPSGKVAPKRSRKSEIKWPELVFAVDLKDNPLPSKGLRVMEVFTDGASRGNPGPASVGVLFRQKNGPDLCEYYEPIGRATNNVAEYKAVLAALEHCQRWKVGSVHLFMDSELIVRQLKGVYQVKSPDLRPLYQQVLFLSRKIKDFQVTHIPRAKNAHADMLANKALDQA
ncbi:MAG: ribonuclease HI family protein [Gemmatimonadales bacterium]|nr:ribonuclease HI family protein [Gemmatimonadales bacterium]